MPIPNSPAFDIATMLIEEELVTEGEDIFVGRMTDRVSQDTPVVCVYDTPTEVPANAGYLRDEPTIQIVVRGKGNDYVDAWKKAEEVKGLLLGAKPRTINSVDYVGFFMNGDLFSLGYDEQDRPKIVANYRLVREYEEGGNRRPL